MQVNVNSGPSRRRVMSSEIQEWVKRCSRVRVQQCLPQARLASFADGQILSLIAGVTQTQLPVPTLEVISKFAHFAAQANIEQIIMVSKLIVSRTGVVNAAESNSGSYRKAASIRKETWNSRVRDGERIKRILNWHADAGRTKTYVSAWNFEGIRQKWHRCRRRIE